MPSDWAFILICGSVIRVLFPEVLFFAAGLLAIRFLVTPFFAVFVAGIPYLLFHFSSVPVHPSISFLSIFELFRYYAKKHTETIFLNF
jgi:hypothetical protein